MIIVQLKKTRNTDRLEASPVVLSVVSNATSESPTALDDHRVAPTINNTFLLEASPAILSVSTGEILTEACDNVTLNSVDTSAKKSNDDLFSDAQKDTIKLGFVALKLKKSIMKKVESFIDQELLEFFQKQQANQTKPQVYFFQIKCSQQYCKQYIHNLY